MNEPDTASAAIEKSPKPSIRKVRKDNEAVLVRPSGHLIEVPEGNRLYPRGGISETAAGIDPRPIPWVVFFAAVPLVIGYLFLMGRLVLGLSSGWQETALLGLHAAGCVAVLVAYFGKSTTVGGLTTKSKP